MKTKKTKKPTVSISLYNDCEEIEDLTIRRKHYTSAYPTISFTYNHTNMSAETNYIENTNSESNDDTPTTTTNTTMIEDRVTHLVMCCNDCSESIWVKIYGRCSLGFVAPSERRKEGWFLLTTCNTCWRNRSRGISKEQEDREIKISSYFIYNSDVFKRIQEIVGVQLDILTYNSLFIRYMPIDLIKYQLGPECQLLTISNNQIPLSYVRGGFL